MVIDISYFDAFVDEDYLVKITKCKVLYKTPCYSSKIRLRSIRSFISTFHLDDFKSSAFDVCYGMFYTLEIDDLEIFKMYHSHLSYLKDIEVSTIKVNSVEDFMKNDFKIINHNTKCLCFVSKREEINIKRYKNRKTKVNFNKKLLLNFLKI